jgi:hypothetical protein
MASIGSRGTIVRSLVVAAIASMAIVPLPGGLGASPIAFPAAAQAISAALAELGDPSELRTAFNRDRGRTRLVLLVSPT